jgi:hypothetical protein
MITRAQGLRSACEKLSQIVHTHSDAAKRALKHKHTHTRVNGFMPASAETGMREVLVRVRCAAQKCSQPIVARLPEDSSLHAGNQSPALESQLLQPPQRLPPLQTMHAYDIKVPGKKSGGKGRPPPPVQPEGMCCRIMREILTGFSRAQRWTFEIQQTFGCGSMHSTSSGP